MRDNAGVGIRGSAEWGDVQIPVGDFVQVGAEIQFTTEELGKTDAEWHG